MLAKSECLRCQQELSTDQSAGLVPESNVLLTLQLLTVFLLKNCPFGCCCLLLHFVYVMFSPIFVYF